MKKFEKYIENIGEFKEAIQTFRVKNLTERIGEEQMAKMKDMTKSEIEETIEMSVNSEQERKLLKEAFKLLLGKEERL